VAVGVGLALYPRTLGDGTLKSLQGDGRFGLGQAEPDFNGAGGSWQPPPMDGARIEPWRDYHSGFALGEAGGAALAPAAAAAPVSVNATTTIYVNGSADPGAT
jgi:hypothetical protein